MFTQNITPKPALMKKVLLRTISVLTLAAVLFSTLTINAKPTDLKPVFIGLNDVVLNGKVASDATYRKSIVDINHATSVRQSSLQKTDWRKGLEAALSAVNTAAETDVTSSITGGIEPNYFKSFFGSRA